MRERLRGEETRYFEAGRLNWWEVYQNELFCSTGSHEKSDFWGEGWESKACGRKRLIRWQGINGRFPWWTPAMIVMIKVIELVISGITHTIAN